ncbi:MAG: response regulator transcription factor [Acidobacteria bacterium]|nr:response regulator transcription factor [Acidobacteriota bacterium]
MAILDVAMPRLRRERHRDAGAEDGRPDAEHACRRHVDSPFAASGRVRVSSEGLRYGGSHRGRRGKTNRQIAEALNIRPTTVETHRARILHELNLHSTTELVLWAVRHRVVG